MPTILDADLLLLGGGHSQLFVLEALRTRPDLAERTLLVTGRADSLYSGMVPGVLEGRYAPRECRIPVTDLAHRVGVRVIVARGVGLDAGKRMLELSDGRVVRFRFLSLNVGSTVAAQDVPGVTDHALPTRPLERFLETVQAHRTETGNASPLVVGGGAAGVEIAFTLHGRGRMRSSGTSAAGGVTLIHDDASVPKGASFAIRRRVARQARGAGIDLVLDRRVVEVVADGVVLDDGERISGGPVVWATGAEGTSLLRGSGLHLDARGFVQVRPTLQAEGHPHVLAAGDCAVPLHHPNLPRAGVHAVRQGPVLARNAFALLDDEPPETYRPQGDFLRLLNLGDGTAIGGKWGLAVRGAWVMWLKDRIDRDFIRRFS